MMINVELIAGLTKEEIKIINNYAEKFTNIESIKVFGSRAMETYKEASDIDIAIFGEKADKKTASDLKFEIEEESDLPYFFDVLSYNDINTKELKEHIDKYGVLIFRQGG